MTHCSNKLDPFWFQQYKTMELMHKNTMLQCIITRTKSATIHYLFYKVNITNSKHWQMLDHLTIAEKGLSSRISLTKHIKRQYPALTIRLIQILLDFHWTLFSNVLSMPVECHLQKYLGDYLYKGLQLCRMCSLEEAHLYHSSENMQQAVTLSYIMHRWTHWKTSSYCKIATSDKCLKSAHSS